MQEITFYKEHTGRWYADIPEWPGSKDELEMVCGADTMLDVYAQGDFKVTLKMDLVEPMYPCDKLIFQSLSAGTEDSGAYYEARTILLMSYSIQIWLCPVTLFVFGEYPENIYVNKIN